MKPFIYISGLFRSGTTLAQELLTEKGKSFIFHEPRCYDMGWQFREHDERYLREKWGLELPDLTSPADTWRYFMEDLGLQIGVKEIRNRGGLFYYDAWMGNLRLVIVEREPQEIYKSCYKMFMRSNQNFRWRPRFLPFTPMNLYREVIDEIKNLNSIWDWVHPECKTVLKYRNMVDGDSEAIDNLYKFLESDVTAPEIGQYHSILPRGKYETDLHKGKITNRAVGLSEIPNKIKDEAERFAEMLKGEKLWI